MYTNKYRPVAPIGHGQPIPIPCRHSAINDTLTPKL